MDIITKILNVLLPFTQIFRGKVKNQNWWNNPNTDNELSVKIPSKNILEVQERASKTPDPLWVYPVNILRVTSPYGWRRILGRRRWHNGVDYTGWNKKCHAVTNVIITKVLQPDTEYPVKFRYNSSTKKFERIPNIPRGRAWTPYIVANSLHDPNVRFVYRHVKATCHVDDVILAGTDIGQIGNYGFCMGSHLHFEVQVKRGNRWVEINPVTFLNRKVKKEQSGKLAA